MDFLELVRKIKIKNANKVCIVKSGIFYYALVMEKYCKLDKVKFCYYDRLKAVLVIHISISCNMDNIMECRIYDNDIDIFLDKYILNDICILCGSLKNKKV